MIGVRHTANACKWDSAKAERDGQLWQAIAIDKERERATEVRFAPRAKESHSRTELDRPQRALKAVRSIVTGTVDGAAAAVDPPTHPRSRTSTSSNRVTRSADRRKEANRKSATRPASRVERDSLRHTGTFHRTERGMVRQAHPSPNDDYPAALVLQPDADGSSNG